MNDNELGSQEDVINFGPKESLCLKHFKSKKIWLTQNLGPNEFGTSFVYSKLLGQKCLAIIWQMWINVTRTNVVWTNVTLTVEFCSKSSQEPTFKVSSKSGQ